MKDILGGISNGNAGRKVSLRLSVPSMKKIPVCQPYLNGKELEYVQDAVSSTWISSQGKYLDRFEREFPNYVGMKYGTSTCNGTTALHLALRAIGIGPGDEVILPSFTMIATAFAISYCGATPVLVDANPDDWNLDVSKLEAAISPRSKAVLVVHIYGHPTDMDQVVQVASRHGLVIVEDAAEAIGSEYRSRRCGSLGNVSCFSFFANKNITCGEGGMVLSNEASMHDRLRYLKNLSFPLNKGREYLHDEIGYNYRMSNLHAALGCAQLERVDEYVEMRRTNAALYADRLRNIPGLRLPVERDWAMNTYWMYGVLCEREFGVSRRELIEKLAANGIETRKFFRPMHLQKSIREYGFRAPLPMPVSEQLGENGLYLPSSSSLRVEDIDYIVQTISEIQRGRI
jgi:perosamine synthetase